MNDNYILNERIIVIDLGTTYSCAAIMRNEKVDVILENSTGEYFINSLF